MMHNPTTTAAGTERARNQARLEELQLEDMLKKNIITQAKFFYGPEYPVGSTFDVITHNGKGDYYAGACLVVYTRKDSLDAREVLQANEQTCHTVSDALEDLLGSLSDIVAETPSSKSVFVSSQTK